LTELENFAARSRSIVKISLHAFYGMPVCKDNYNVPRILMKRDLEAVLQFHLKHIRNLKSFWMHVLGAEFCLAFNFVFTHATEVFSR
jgi:hypothetical protein